MAAHRPLNEQDLSAENLARLRRVAREADRKKPITYPQNPQTSEYAELLRGGYLTAKDTGGFLGIRTTTVLLPSDKGKDYLQRR